MIPAKVAGIDSVRLLHVALALALGRNYLARDRALHCFEPGKKWCREIGACGGWTSSLFRHQLTVSEDVPHGRSTAFSAISTPSSIWVAAIDINREPNRSASAWVPSA